jgi:amino-acid N-acetyltransferase
MPVLEPRIVLEPAGPADEAAIRKLLREAKLPEEDFTAHLGHFLVARQDGTVVGAVGYEKHGTDALLRSLVVAPGCRHAGLGGRLVAQISARARAAGLTRFYLLTTTAEKFFVTRGFTKVDRKTVPAAVAATPEFQGLCPASAVCMVREVPA